MKKYKKLIVISLLLAFILSLISIFAVGGVISPSNEQSGVASGAASAPSNQKEMLNQENNAEDSASRSNAASPENNAEKNINTHIIRTSNLILKVDEVSSKTSIARDIVKTHNGEVTNFVERVSGQTTSADPEQMMTKDINPIEPPNNVNFLGDYARFEIQVPTQNLDKLLEELRKIGIIVVDSSTSQDVTLEVVGLDAEISSGLKSLTRLEELLKMAKTVDEVLKVEQAVESRKRELASLKARQETLKTQSMKASVTLQLVTDVAVKPTVQEMSWWERTWESITDASEKAVTILVVTFIFLLPMSLITLLFIYLYNFFHKKSASVNKINTDKS